MTLQQLIQTKKEGIYKFCEAAKIDDTHAVALFMIMESTALETAKLVVECVVPEKKDIGYEEGQEEPNIIDEVHAEAYETMGEAWFAGFDNCVQQCLDTAHAMGITE